MPKQPSPNRRRSPVEAPAAAGLPRHPWGKVAIIGVGLIGGSVGLALKERRLVQKVVGIGRRQESLDEAISVGAIDAGTVHLEEGVADADVIVVCTPVGRIVEDIQRVAAVAKASALITDGGSTKAAIVKALDGKVPGKLGQAHFVAAHPLAGSEKNGPRHARADLYEGRLVLITPGKKTLPAAIDAVSDFWAALGGKTVRMNPTEHDKIMANTSHLPHLIASALALTATDQDLPLCGTGFRDTTRIAGGDVEIWTQIFLANQTNTLKSLARFEKTLSALRAALERGDRQKLATLLTEAKQNRDALGS